MESNNSIYRLPITLNPASTISWYVHDPSRSTYTSPVLIHHQYLSECYCFYSEIYSARRQCLCSLQSGSRPKCCSGFCVVALQGSKRQSRRLECGTSKTEKRSQHLVEATEYSQAAISTNTEGSRFVGYRGNGGSGGERFGR